MLTDHDHDYVNFSMVVLFYGIFVNVICVQKLESSLS